MQVRHFGNTANNAYYNALILDRYAGFDSVLPIRMFGLQHAISAPAWEAVDFDVPDAEWVSTPDWSEVAGATDVNARFTDIPVPAASAEPTGRARGAGLVTMLGRAIAPLRGQRWAQVIFDARYRQLVAGRPRLSPFDGIDLFYGADSIVSLAPESDAPRTVCLEHGTVRWIADGSADLKVLRDAYREQVRRSGHLWVTNLDPRTLEVAEDLVPGRWMALPHPYVPDPRVPFAESERRADLLRQTGASALVLLPSSQNWGKHHDKGSIRALHAFVELRRSGADVGLVAVQWGLQLEDSKQFLRDAGVADAVVWVPPMARFGLQRMMADVDVVWDQFGLEAFGGLANRAVEQGTPFISRGLAAEGERLIGGPVPWRQASTTDDIVRETRGVLDDIARDGRDRVVAATQKSYREWFRKRHAPEITAALQSEVYAGLLDGGAGTVDPARWARIAAGRSGEDA